MSPLLFFTLPGHALVLLCLVSPLPCLTLPCLVSPAFCLAPFVLPCLASSRLFRLYLPCVAFALLYLALSSPCFALPCRAFVLPCLALSCLCFALPCLVLSRLCFALPCHCHTSRLKETETTYHMVARQHTEEIRVLLEDAIVLLSTTNTTKRYERKSG